ncbi:uncharacterized protein LOC129747337 [Uranotaenia lowii]|uniref:uncharacterized protein LOC129747337 n=1 Tax=Uranotaenia lowii TaxID=190385 RepID=UPI0024795F2B|nr:uncharacterized protein LOC129747337 [Uranotaenia lowii]
MLLRLKVFSLGLPRRTESLLAALLLGFLCIGGFINGVSSADKYEEGILFKYYNSTRDVVHAFSFATNKSYEYDVSCNPSEKFAIVVFGWKVGCDKYFVQDLIGNLTKHRGGCVICMDYDVFAQVPSYLRLRGQKTQIQNILKRKLQFLEAEGFNPDNGYLYGFSFGANMVLEAAKEFGVKKIKQIDVCEVVGMAMDATFAVAPNWRKAAKNVQCIHTSKQYGTRFLSSCHQDWILGDCGEQQDAAPLSAFGSHGVCTLFYNSAFEHDFLAIEKPSNCTADQEAEDWPEGFKMGYMETRKTGIRGQLFARTYGKFPFNEPAEEPAVTETANALRFDPVDFSDYGDIANDFVTND